MDVKTFYTVVFVSCVILLILFCLPATPSKLGFIHRLALHPDKWELLLNDPDQKVFGENTEHAKTKLLAFLERYRHTYRADVGWLTSGLIVAALFSLLGRARESWFAERCAELAVSPNGAAAGDLGKLGTTGAPPSMS
jgi:hypothetical protein